MIVYGKQVVLYILETKPQLIEEVMLSKEIDKKLFSKFVKLNKPIIKLDNKKAQGLAHGGNHQGFFLKLQDFNLANFSDIKKSNFILILDGLTDVGNIGAISRTAYSLGVDAIVVSNVNNVNIEGCIRTSSGALLNLPMVLEKDILSVANELGQSGFELIGADMNGVDIKKHTPNYDKKIALFLGNEGSGLSPKVIKKLNQKVSIKMYNKFDSLNVSVAAGILIHHLKG